MKNFALLFLAGCACAPAPKKVVATEPPKPLAPSQADGLTAFETVRGVLQSPRCQNCHPAGDAPLQGEDGREHAMNVQRGPDGGGRAGEACSACHGPANPSSNYGLHVPPGAADGWRMPKPEQKLVFVGLSSGDLCRRLVDPTQNGGKDLAALRAHLDTPLVTWGWEPGFGRAPVATPFPQFISAWETWARAGTPCPQ